MPTENSKMRPKCFFLIFVVAFLVGCGGLWEAPNESGVQQRAFALIDRMRSGQLEPHRTREQLRTLLREVEETKVHNPRDALAYSDASLICILLMEIDLTDVERCKGVYRRAVDASRKSSDPAYVFNSVDMLRSIKDDEAVGWILGVGLLGDKVMTRWAIETVGDLAEEAAQTDSARADFLIRNLTRYCDNDRLPSKERSVCRHRREFHAQRVDAVRERIGRSAR